MADVAQGWTRRHRTVLLVAWLGWTFDIMDAAVFNFAKQRMVTELVGGKEAYAKVGVSTEAGLLTSFLIGWSLGGLAFGWLADRWGRWKTLTLTVLVYSVFTGLTAFCHDLGQASALRFLTGLGIGGEWAAGAVLIAESVPEGTRAKAASWLQTAAVAGPLLASLANVALAAQGWRALFLFGALPAVLTVFVRFAVGRAGDEGPRPTTSSEEVKPTQAHVGNVAVRMAVALVLGTAGIAMAQNVTFWLPNFVSALSQGVPQTELQARLTWATMTLHIGTLAGVFLVPALCERFGRRPALLACFVLSPLSVLVVASLARTYGALLVCAPLMSVFSIGIGAGFVLYFPELFPRPLRATGAGLAYNGGRILATLFPMLTAFLILESRGNVAQSVAQTSIVLAVGGLSLLYSPETKGKALAT